MMNRFLLSIGIFYHRFQQGEGLYYLKNKLSTISIFSAELFLNKLFKIFEKSNQIGFST